NFSPPPANSSDKPVLRGENTSETRVDVCTLTGKLATIYTPPTYTEHRIYKEVHNILHYVSKNNPQGPAPADPANADIEYANWEEAVQIWIENNKEEFLKLIQPDPDQPIDPDVVIILNESPPAEEDDDHRPELQPQIRITSPENNQLFNDNLISVSVDAEAPGGVGRLEYYIDDFLYYSDLTFPFGETSFDITDVPNGFHRLKVIAYDPIDNFKEDQIQFQLQAPKPALTISWAEPANSLSLTAENFPLTLTVALSQMDNVQKVNFYAKENRGQLINISADENLENNQASIVWEEPPGPGTYKLQAEALTLTETVPGAGLIVIIQ
ncbi:MAG TPA: Ig-like domain-containing protein, partial [Patescibacteria group bacterium]